MDNEAKPIYVPPGKRNAPPPQGDGAGGRNAEPYRPVNRRNDNQYPVNRRFRDLSAIKGFYEVGGGMTAREAMIYPPGENELFANTSQSVNYQAFGDVEQKIELPDKDVEVYPVSEFAQLKLNATLLQNIARCKYSQLTPVQQNSIPVIQKKYDALVLANTGSGKTASFAIPIINSLLEKQDSFKSGHSAQPKAIVIVPTRELAMQTALNFYQLSYNTGLRVRIAYGGDSSREQAIPFREGCDVLIGCPGRLLDFLRKNLYSFSNIKYLVIDEMDRLFEIGFEEQVKQLVYEMPNERYTLLFSATNPESVQVFVNSYTRNHAKVTIGNSGVCQQINQSVLFVEENEKQQALLELLSDYQKYKSLVFTDTKIKAQQLYTSLLNRNFKVEQLHGDMTYEQRTKTFSRMKNGDSQILITTDVAQRGLDIQGVGLVVNYDVPQNNENYVHRIGRTGRVGSEGTAVTFVSRPYTFQSDNLIRFIKDQIIKSGREVPDNIKNHNKFERHGRDSYGSRYPQGGRYAGNSRVRNFYSVQPRATPPENIITIEDNNESSGNIYWKDL